MRFPESLPLFLAEDVRANESWKPSSASLDIFCLCLPALLKEKWLPHHCPIPQQLFGNLPLTSTLQLACTLSTDHFLFLNPYAPNGSIFGIYEVSDILLRAEHGWKKMLESWWKLLESSIIYPLEKYSAASVRASTPCPGSPGVLRALLNSMLAQGQPATFGSWLYAASPRWWACSAAGPASFRKEGVSRLPCWHRFSSDTISFPHPHSWVQQFLWGDRHPEIQPASGAGKGQKFILVHHLSPWKVLQKQEVIARAGCKIYFTWFFFCCKRQIYWNWIFLWKREWF